MYICIDIPYTIYKHTSNDLFAGYYYCYYFYFAFETRTNACRYVNFLSDSKLWCMSSIGQHYSKSFPYEQRQQCSIPIHNTYICEDVHCSDPPSQHSIHGLIKLPVQCDRSIYYSTLFTNVSIFELFRF